jgi:hypothetical protein
MERNYGSKPFVPADFEIERRSIAIREMVRIVNALPFFPRDHVDEAVTDYREFSYVHPFYCPDVEGLSDGIAVRWATDLGLGRLAHILTISDDGELSYHRISFDTDFQAVASPNVHLIGFDRVSQNNDAVYGLLYTPSSAQHPESDKRG